MCKLSHFTLLGNLHGICICIIIYPIRVGPKKINCPVLRSILLYGILKVWGLHAHGPAMRLVGVPPPPRRVAGPIKNGEGNLTDTELLDLIELVIVHFRRVEPPQRVATVEPDFPFEIAGNG